MKRRCLHIVFLSFLLVFTYKTEAQSELNKYNELFRNGNYNEALSEINRLISSKGTAVSCQYYCLQAELYSLLYSNTGKQNISYLENSLGSLKNAVSASDYSSKKDDVVKIAGEIAREFYKNGISDYNNEDYKSAQSDFLKAAGLFDISGNFADLHKLYYLLAFSSKSTGDNENAVKYLNILIQNNYNDENVYLYLSELYKSSGNDRMSIEIMKKAALKFSSADSYYDLIYTFYNSGNKDSAMYYINEFGKLNIYNSNINMVSGTIYYEENKLDSALSVFKRIVLNEPENIQANFNAGIILYNSGMNIMKNAEKNYYDSPDKYRAEKDKYLERIKEAVIYLEKSYNLDNSNINAANCLLDIYKRLQRNTEYDNLKSALEKVK